MENSLQVDHDEKSHGFEYDEENVDHGEKTHPCDEMVGLEMTDDSEHKEASENDGAGLVNVHPCDKTVGLEMTDD